MCTTVYTIPVHGSSEVMAPTGNPGHYIPGAHQRIRVIKAGPDEETPLEIREDLVGLEICTIFSGTLLIHPSKGEGARVGYLSEVIATLLKANKKNAAELLQREYDKLLIQYMGPEEYGRLFNLHKKKAEEKAAGLIIDSAKEAEKEAQKECQRRYPLPMYMFEPGTFEYVQSG